MCYRIAVIISVVALIIFTVDCTDKQENKQEKPIINVAISPYQDIAMIVNIHNLDLEQKYDLDVKLHTMAWEDILTAIASAGETVDIGFGSYIEYLNKEKDLNPPGSDPIVFIYPAYIFKGGSFITFDPKIPSLTWEAIENQELVRNFLSFRIGAQKGSIYEMMIYSLANRANLDLKSLRLYDTPLNDGILATQRGSLDIASAGLTQIAETKKRGGRIILTMEDLGFADITGFICKKSTLGEKREEIDNLIRMWFECVRYVMSDLGTNSAYSLEYLRRNASTQYTMSQYKEALSQEYFPLSITEANEEIVADDGKYSYTRIGGDVGIYLVTVKKFSSSPSIPDFIVLAE